MARRPALSLEGLMIQQEPRTHSADSQGEVQFQLVRIEFTHHILPRNRLMRWATTLMRSTPA
jgi:hypothetical protein